MSSRAPTEKLMRFLWRLKGLLFTRLIASAFQTIGSESRIYPPLRFSNLRAVALGRRVTIGEGAWIQALEADPLSKIPKLIIGDGVLIGMGATISAIDRYELRAHALLTRNVCIPDARPAHSGRLTYD